MNDQTLTANEARRLDKCLRFCEYVISQQLQHKTNVVFVHQQVWAKIVEVTDPFMQATVYSVPGISPPA